MRPPSSADGTDRETRRRPSLPGRLLLVPLPLATVLLAAVHPTPRAVVGLASAGIGLAAWWQGRPDHLDSGARLALRIALVAWAMGLLSFLPVGDELCLLLQGPIGAAVRTALDVAGGGNRPLAVDLPAAIEAMTWSGAMLALAAGTAACMDSRRRRLRLAWTIVATGAAVVVLGFAQDVLAVDSILGFTGVPAVRREPFFATFVNPNHASTLLAASAVLGASMLGRPRPFARVLGAAAAALCVAGVAATGSRGGALSALVGIGLLVTLAAPVRVAVGTFGMGLVGAIAAVLAGGRSLADRLSAMADGPGTNGDPWSGRLEFWADAVDLVMAAPLLGVGPGGYDFASRFAKTSPRFIVPRHAHQEPLQALVEWGVPGGCLWIIAALLPVGVAISRIRKQRHGRRRTLLAAWVGAAGAILVGCLVDFPLRIGTLSILAACIWGVLLPSDDAGAPPRSTVRGTGVLAAGVAGMLCAVMPLRDAWMPAAHWSPGSVQFATADEARRQARDLHLLDIDDPEPWRATARAALADRLRARPLDAQPLLRLAQLELDAGTPDAAVPILEAAVRVQPRLPWAWFGLAKAAGASEKGRSAWRRGLALNVPDNDAAADWIVQAIDAGTEGTHWHDVIPDRPDRLRDAAVLLARRGERTTAEEMFARGVALDPDVGVAAARWMLRWGETQRALDLLGSVEDQGCQSLRVHGEALLAAGRAAEAVPRLIDARALCPEDPRLDRTIGMARAASHDAAGVPLLVAWLDHRPDDLLARRALLALLRAHGRWGEMADHLSALDGAGVATDQEQADLPRARLGLPLR